MIDIDSNARAIFYEALDRASPEALSAFLDEACGQDPELRGRVDDLLRAHREAGNFLGGVVDDTIEHSPITEGPGTVIGAYKLLQQIGEGGFGVVFLAEQERPVRRRVALKVIKPGMDTRQVIARFEAERQALALMDHPNIAKVYDAGATENGRPYFVMELVQGVPITEYCDQCNLTTRERLELFVTVCQAVQHAHQKGIIHRDIKPTNVLVAIQDGQPAPKIIDFGVAKAINQQLTEHTLMTAFAQIIGTPLYMSPEQAELSPLGVDTRSDIYSLGALLYELLTGATPFDKDRLHAASYDEFRRIIREEEPPRPSARLSTLSADLATTIAEHRRTDARRLGQTVRGELDWIVMKCLEKDRNRRYETPNGLARDIERYPNDEPVQACPPSRSYRLKKFIRRNKVAVLAGSAVAVTLIVGLTLASIGFIQARRQAAIARTEAVRADRAAVRATAVSDFLQQMLQSANPDQLKGQEYTVRQLLDDFSAGLSDQLTSQPEVEADLQKTIGLAYRRVNANKCEKHLQRAMELRRSLVGDQHEEFANSMVDYADALREHFRGGDAEPYLRRALAIYEKRGTGGRPVIRALQVLQIVLQVQNRFSEIEPVVDKAVAIANQSPDEQFPEIANIYHGLIIAKIEESNYAEAEAFGRKCVELHLRLQGQNHPETGWGYYNLARADAANHKFAEAIEAYKQAAVIFQRALPVGNWNTAATLEALTPTLQLAGESDRLIELFDSADKLDELVAVYRESFPDNMDLSQGDSARVAAAVQSGLAELADIHLKLAAQYATAGKTDKADQTSATAALLQDEQRLCGLKLAQSAKAIARRMLEIDQRDPVALHRIAWTLAFATDPAHRDPVLAIELAEKALVTSQNNGNIWNTVGVAKYRAGEWHSTVEALTKSMELRGGGDAIDWFFLAMAHWRLGHKDDARKWYDKAAEWTDKNAPQNEELSRFRQEAAELLGIPEPQPSNESVAPTELSPQNDNSTSTPTTD